MFNIINQEVVFWNLLVLIYFSTKNIILKKFLKTDNQIKMPSYYTVIITIASIIINTNLINNYNGALNAFYIREAIKLPPITLLIIVADLITTIIMYIKFYVPNAKNIGNTKIFTVFIDFARLLFVYVVFTIIISSILNYQVNKFNNYDIYCFKRQLSIDLGAYYYNENKFPETLEDFTSSRTYPFNSSSLIFQKPDERHVIIVDEAGNQILDSYLDMIGFTNKGSITEFLKEYKIDQKTYCQSKLVFPE